MRSASKFQFWVLAILVFCETKAFNQCQYPTKFKLVRNNIVISSARPENFLMIRKQQAPFGMLRSVAPSNVVDETQFGESKAQRGAISMDLEELSEELGGLGRAQVAWDYMRIGVDPQAHFRDGISSSSTLDTFMKGVDADHDDIQKLLPKIRRTQQLGKSALDKLQDLYGSYGGMLDGGVAKLSHVSSASDGTTKLLIKLRDGLEVETVIIPWFDKGWSSVCVSSQVGCKQGCTFCATGRMGKLRSLTSTEILAQHFYALKICRLASLPTIHNVIFMGMGEPCDNVEEVRDAVKVLTHGDLFQLGKTKVTVSTVAPSPEAFAELKDAPCALAWSVHAANDKLRKKLVPTTKHSMNELRQALIDALLSRKKRMRTIMLEVALISGVNDGALAAKELAEFSQVIIDQVPSVKVVVNLIPFNDIGHPTFQTPSMESVRSFQKILSESGIRALVRTTRGDDEGAACGQLATKKANK